MSEAEAVRPARTERFERRREAIVAAAVEVMNRKGVKAMTLAEVAGALDLVPTGVIYYFKNKEALASACFLRALEQFNGLLAEAEAAATPQARVTGFLHGFFELRHRIRTGAAPPLAYFNDVRALNVEAVNLPYNDMFRRFRALIGPQPGLSRADLNARAHLLLSEVLWVVTWDHWHDIDDYARLAERMADILVNGLAAPGARFAPAPLPPLAGPEGNGELSRERFLKAATELINEQGYVGASVDRISARLNVTKGAFYYHNDDKDDLVSACFERSNELVRGAIRAGEAAAPDGLTQLASSAAALVEYQLAGEAPLLRTSALTSAPEHLQPVLLGQFDRLTAKLAAILSDGIADRSIRPVDVNIAAQLITAMINASAELQFWSPTLTPDDAADAYARPLFEGLFAP